MNNKKKILIVLGILIVTLSIIGVSYAFFSALIKGNNTAKNNTVQSGTMELTFLEQAGSSIYLENAKPNDTAEKKFTVENTGTLDDIYTYNIKLTNLNTTFEQEDLQYTLVEYTDDNYNAVKDQGVNVSGFINKDTVINKNEQGIGEMYLAINITRPENNQLHYYKLIIEFKELNVPQNYNQGAEFRGTINVDDNPKAMLYDELQNNKFYATMMSNPSEVLKDDFDNLRYVGASNEVNNYIWFNCDDYTKVTDAASAQTQNCEKWRIIGLFNNIKTVTEDGQDKRTENLVKIIRADSIGNISWDESDADNEYGSNDWTTATLQEILNKDSDATGYLNPNYNSSNVKGITAATKGMIEKVEWNLGGTPNAATETTQGFYTAERGSTTNGSQPTIWNGYIGLMYASDYGYATAGGTKKSRQDCLDYQLYGWDTDDYTTYCANTNWLKPSSNSWTLTPHSRYSYYAVYVNRTGRVDLSYVYATIGIRPSLYLKSSVKVLDDGVSDGSVNNPFILEIEQ